MAYSKDVSDVQGFDIAALYAALDEQRRERVLTWAAVTREINSSFKDVDARPISSSTITGMRGRGANEGNGIIQMLIWLDRTPESFVPEYRGPEAKLPSVATDWILRWHTGLMYTALDEQRVERGMTWKQVAEELGPRFTAATLKRLVTPGLVAFPHVMRIFSWLGRPAADFARPSRVKVIHPLIGTSQCRRLSQSCPCRSTASSPTLTMALPRCSTGTSTRGTSKSTLEGRTP